jgi:indole-3-glycerol phosphate synthase
MYKKNQNSKSNGNKFLEKIVTLKRAELVHKNLRNQKITVSTDQKDQNFLKAMKQNAKKVALITEIKFASIANPHLGSPQELLTRAKQYELSGADAISLITEKNFFKGDIAFVSKVKKHVSVPVLQKDFVIDRTQIYEAKKAGSDALLLIARLVDAAELNKFVLLCFSLGIEPVVEINNEEDLEKALCTQTNIIAVNARDLETFVVDVVTACMLIEKIPENFIKLGFSGIKSHKEVLLYKESGVAGVLTGTSLMKTKKIKDFIESLQL